MQYDANSPGEYLELLEPDWRKEKLEQLRELLLSHPLKEGVQYKMLCYYDERGVIFFLNAQKSYTALYVGDAKKVDSSGDLLKGIDHGKGCIRFKKSTSIADTQISDFIAKTIEMWQKGEDVGC